MIVSQVRSLSARRAWIEICLLGCCARLPAVALRKESVDRNLLVAGSLTMGGGSLSARRAWIEICYLDNIEISEAVALRKESVDRNNLPS